MQSGGKIICADCVKGYRPREAVSMLTDSWACVFVQAQDHADALEMLLETLLLLCSHQLHGKEFRLVRNKKGKKENKKRTFILDVTPKTIISKSMGRGEGW